MDHGGGVCAGVGRHGLASAAGATKGGPHQLQRALSLMEDSIAAAIDPDRLTGDLTA